MTAVRTFLAAFIGAFLAIVLLLDWRASRATGRSLRAALPLVPSEAQRLYVDVKKSRPVGATVNSLEKVVDAL